MDEARRIALDLTRAIQKLQGDEAKCPGRHAQALKQLSDIFGDEVKEVMDAFVLPSPSSSTLTAPQQL